MEKNAVNVTDVGIDYLSFTMKAENPFLQQMKHLFIHGMLRAMQQGEPLHKIAPSGFKGERIGKYFFGECKGLTLFQVSSSEAHKVATEVKALGIEIKATRIDFQATYDRTPELQAFAHRMRSQAERIDRKTQKKRHTKRNLVEGCGSGDSITFGSRSGKRVFICYDKTAEQRGEIEGDKLRDELRLFNEQAERAWLSVLKCETIDILCISLLQAYLRLQGFDRQYSIVAPDMRLPSTSHVSQEEKTVRWLTSICASAFERVKDPRNRQLVADAFGMNLSTVNEAARRSARLEQNTLILDLQNRRFPDL